MKVEDVKGLLQKDFSDAVIQVVGEESNFSVDIVTEVFEGQSRFQRQKSVLAIMKEHIVSGEIHAFNVNAYTPAEWEKAQQTITIL